MDEIERRENADVAARRTAGERARKEAEEFARSAATSASMSGLRCKATVIRASFFFNLDSAASTGA